MLAIRFKFIIGICFKMFSKMIKKNHVFTYLNRLPGFTINTRADIMVAMLDVVQALGTADDKKTICL